MFLKHEMFKGNATINSDQIQIFWGVLRRCSENMQQINWRTPMPRCDFNKVANLLLPINALNHEHISLSLFFNNAIQVFAISIFHFFRLTFKLATFCLHSKGLCWPWVYWNEYPVDLGRKLNVHKTFNVRPVSTGYAFATLW